MLGLTHNSRLIICLTVIAGSIALAAAPANAATVKVSTPTAGSSVAGDLPLKAELQVSKNVNVREVRWRVRGEYVNGTDHNRPYPSPKNATVDLTDRSPGPCTINIQAEYTYKDDDGDKHTTKVKKSINVTVIDPTPPPAYVDNPATPVTPTTPTVNPENWRVVFNDEFDSLESTLGKWSPFRSDWITGRRPYNILEGAGYAARNTSVKEGNLHIKLSDKGTAGLPMSTGSVNTLKSFTFKYGYIEARMRVPKCFGCWPAFWTLSGREVWPPEHDIFEFFNSANAPYPVSALHRAADDDDGQEYTSLPMAGFYGGDYTDAWHTYSMYWAPDQVRMFVDRVPGALFTDALEIPTESMYPIIQLAVYKGTRPPAGTTMQVDYVRIFQYKGPARSK
jgi:beta-glucanase (GH16 family)